MLVSEMNENLDLVFRIKNIFELEVIIKFREPCFCFLNRSIQLFPKEQVVLKHREQRIIKTEAPFIEEISGLIIVEMLDKRNRVH